MQLLFDERTDRLITSDAATVRVYDGASDPPTQLGAHERLGEVCVFSQDPTGERIAGVVAGRFARAFTPPGQGVHWSRALTSIGIYDLALGERVLAIGRRLDPRSLALSPDGSRIAASSYGAGVIVIDVTSGAILWEHDGDISSGVAWSPDGRWIAVGETGQGGGTLSLLDPLGADDGAKRKLPAPSKAPGLYDSPFQACFTSDGATVAFANASWGGRGLSLYDVGSAQERWSVTFERASEDEDADDDWAALDVAFVVEDAVVVTGVEQGVRAYRVADGTELSALDAAGASPYFAVDRGRRRVWLSFDGELVARRFPDDWAR
jgi:WD40 repeat protein